ncbi:hypothetical protein G4Z16_01040 [Streptomyces bathyalis]|uniref:N-acetyltransferase domain-containing protein n=1 Tax=Streptomyces bathyalis TaxID=2710756 RepID=A0A7T1T2H5_9ACTN|nr:hypothetical protein [Streptomyces bathyalis]QPP05203.1 hypothetical protein G4Z16_01040 [Streptomyces bathyalis]
MTYTPRRPVSELPFSGSDIMLRYNLEHPAVPFDFEETLETWSVGISRYHGEDESCPNCSQEQECDFYESGTPIGSMSFVRIRDYTSDPAWEAADSHSRDIEKVVAMCTDSAYSMTPGLHWSKDFEEVIEMSVGDLLIMDRVHINPEWRGFGIGALAAAEAIRRLSSGCCAVACEPAPTDREFGDDETAFTKAQTKIAKVWESVGFEPFKNGIYLLDCAMQHLQDCRRTWQNHFAR